MNSILDKRVLDTFRSSRIIEHMRNKDRAETVSAKIPSRSSNRKYNVTINPDCCECRGFEFRGKCAHVKAVRQHEEMKEQYAEVN